MKGGIYFQSVLKIEKQKAHLSCLVLAVLVLTSILTGSIVFI